MKNYSISIVLLRNNLIENLFDFYEAENIEEAIGKAIINIYKIKPGCFIVCVPACLEIKNLVNNEVKNES